MHMAGQFPPLHHVREKGYDKAPRRQSLARQIPSMLHVHFLPSLTTPEDLAGGTVVVIDVLRASTTITHALAAGAREVIPCLEIDEAREVAGKLPSTSVVLGGERGGLPIEGFHVGNSPIEYTRRLIEGKTVVFTTTNGTRAMMHCRQADRVLIGSFVNRGALLPPLAHAADVHLLCAGTNGQITRDDVLFAGCVVAELCEEGRPEHELNDSGRIAAEIWHCLAQAVASQQDSNFIAAVSSSLKRTQGGRNLRALGLEGDIDTAAQLDRFSIVPELHLQAWRIRAS